MGTCLKEHLTFLLEALHHELLPPAFCGHRHCGIGDIMLLICQVTTRSKVQIIENFLSKNPRKEMMKAK